VCASFCGPEVLSRDIKTKTISMIMLDNVIFAIFGPENNFCSGGFNLLYSPSPEKQASPNQKTKPHSPSPAPEFFQTNF